MALARLFTSASSMILLSPSSISRHVFVISPPLIGSRILERADFIPCIPSRQRFVSEDARRNLEVDSLHDKGSDKAFLDQAPVLTKDADGNGLQKPWRDYLSLSDEELLAECRMDTFRASGPGGQHRNKTNSAVRLRHIPTGLASQAADDRSQHRNRSLALRRLRMLISLKVRCPVKLENYHPPAELVRILPISKRLGGNVQQIGPQHEDFSKGAQCLLDLIWEVEGSISNAARLLSLSTGALNKVISSEKLVRQSINELRVSKGMKPLH